MRKVVFFIIVSFIIIINFVSASFGYNKVTDDTQDINIFQGNLTNLSQMADVNIPTPTDTYALTYDAGTGTWVDTAIGATNWNANYSVFLTHITWANAMNGTLMSQATFNSNYTDWNESGFIIDWNVSGWIKDWNVDIVSANATMKSYVDATASGESNTTIGIYNDTMKAYVDIMDTTFNTSAINYADAQDIVANTSATSWIDLLFVKFTELVAQVGNWSADMTNYYNKTEVIANITSANSTMKSYVDIQDTTFNNSIKAYVDVVATGESNATIAIYNATMKAYVDSQDGIYNTSMKAYVDLLNASGLITDWNSSSLIIDWNGSGLIKDWDVDIIAANATMKGYVDGQDGIYNTSMKAYVDGIDVGESNTTIGIYNDTMKAYVDIQDTTFNTSSINYADAQDIVANTSAINWIDLLFPKISELVGFLGNWSADKSSYYNKTEVTANITSANTSMKNYVDGQDTTFNNTMKSYVDIQDTTFNTSMKGYIDLLNASGLIIDWNASGIIIDWNASGLIKDWDTDIVSANSTMKVYVDGQDTVYNTSMKAYVDLLNASGLITDWNSSSLIIDWNGSGLIKDWDVDIIAANATMKGYVDGQDTAFNNSMKAYSDAAFSPIDEPLSLHLNQDNWFNDSAGYINWDGNSPEFNQSKLSTTYHNVSAIQVVTGTGAGTIENIQTYNQITYNVTESSSDYELRVNFTGITEFTTLLVRHKTSQVAGHAATIQIWDYDTSSWEGYGLLSEELTSAMQTFGVYDDSEHIDGGVVQVRFYQVEIGNAGHVHQFDWVSISKGFGTPVGQEIDPLSLHRDGLTPLTGNWSAGFYNITAHWFYGLFNWTEDSEYLSFDGITLSLDQSVLNGTIGMYNDTMQSYVDIQDTTFNNSMKAYLDSQDGIYNTSMKAYVDLLNASGLIIDWNYSDLIIDWNANIVSANTTMKGYVDIQDTTFNNSIKAYVDVQPSMDYSNLALTNISETFDEHLLITKNLSVGGNNISLGSAEGDSSIWFYEDGGYTEFFKWDDGANRFEFSDDVYSYISIQAGTTITGLTGVISAGDFYTTGSGDDLWLGTSTQGNSLFQAYANGSLVIKGLVVTDGITVTEDDPSWTGNQSNYATLSTILGYGHYNSTDFDITDYSTTSTILGYGHYNSTDFDIADYSTTSTILGYGHYNSTNTATPSDGDTTHVSTADQIFDWVIGLVYVTWVNVMNGTLLSQADFDTNYTDYNESGLLKDWDVDIVAANATMKAYADGAFLADLHDDTAPQLGGYLDVDGEDIGSTSDEIENIYVGVNTKIYFGDGQEVSIYYNGTTLILG